jgi:hypothetical protein
MTIDLSRVTNAELLRAVRQLSLGEQHATARLVAALAELDARKLYLGEGCASMFTFCTQVLHLSEGAAYNRIGAARAARQFPIILDLLDTGAVHVTTVRLLAPWLTAENHRAVLDEATHKSKSEVLEIVARLHPQAPVPSSVRKLPVTSAAAPVRIAAPTCEHERPDARRDAPMARAIVLPRVPAVRPLAPDRYQIQFTIDREARDKLRRVQDLLRHVVPDGDPAAIFARALTVLLADLERKHRAAVTHPRTPRSPSSRGRQIPAAVRRAVWDRDGGRCAYVGASGRCTETGLVQLHHVVPYAAGGPATVGNIELRCAAHNRYEAELFFGPSYPMVAREDAPMYG